MNEALVAQAPSAQGDPQGDQQSATTAATTAPSGFGPVLAQARARAGLSVEQAAARIRLTSKQLRAIEDENLQVLPAPAYVNGFVRNYARELGVDAAPLIEDLNAKLKLRGLAMQEPDLGLGGPISGPVLDDRGWRYLVVAVIVIGLLSSLAIGAWRISHTKRAAIETLSAAAPTVTSATNPELATTAAPARPAAATGSSGANTATGTAQPSAAPVSPRSSDSAQRSTAAIAVSTPASSSGTPEVVAPTASAGSAAAGESDARAAAAQSSNLPVVALPGGSGRGSGLLLRFTQRSWVQVSRPDGRVLLSHMGEPGSLEMVNAAAPLVLIVGRVDAVSVEYRGQAVDLKPYANSASGVAKVLLADAAAGNGGQSDR